MNSTKAAIVLIGASVVTLVIGLLALELIFGHWLRGTDWSHLDRLNIVRDRSEVYDVRHIYGADAPPIRYTRDRHGLRGTCPNLAAAQVVTLGGSTTDQVYVDDDQTWQEVMRRQLNAAVLGLNLCVANAGVDGHTTFAHIESLRHWLPAIPQFKPRVVLLYVGINDAAMRLQKGAFDEARQSTGWMDRLKQSIKNNSALYRAISAWRQRSADTPVFAAHKLIDAKQFVYSIDTPSEGIDALVAQNTEAFRARLDTLLAQIARMGARPVCVSQPSIIYKQVDGRWVGIPKVFTYQGKAYNGLDYRLSLLALNRTMAQDCSAAGGWYIDIESRSFVATDFYDGAHMTPAGAARVGEQLAAEFQRQGIVALFAGADAR